MSLRHRVGTVLLAGAPWLGASLLQAQVADAPPDTIADIPVNYYEALSGAYSIPDPLVMVSGAPVRDSAMWFSQRRPELIRLSAR